MSIWKKPISVQSLNDTSANTATSHLGIELTEVGDDFVRGRVPVDERTRQPFGLLHGGVSVVLAETLGSLGAYYAAPKATVPWGWTSTPTTCAQPPAAGSPARHGQCTLAAPRRFGRLTWSTTRAS